MADRSEEATTSRDSPSTEELLEETDDLLSSSSGSSSESDADRMATRPNSSETSTEPLAGEDPSGTSSSSPETDSGESSSGWLPSWPSRLRPWGAGDDDGKASGGSRLALSRAVSPRSLLAVALVLGAGLLAGGAVIPIAGRIVGPFAAAFLVGALASRRRYLEMAVAAVGVGATGAVFDNVMVAVGGSARTVVAVGAGTAVATALLGYYFGRDLRNGLRRDV